MSNKSELKEICESAYASIVEMVDTLARAEEAGDSLADEEAREAITETPLEITYNGTYNSWREKWETTKIVVLLTWGGPAVRIVVGYDGQSLMNPRLEVQDWFTPWTNHYELNADVEERYLQAYLDALALECSVPEER